MGKFPLAVLTFLFISSVAAEENIYGSETYGRDYVDLAEELNKNFRSIWNVLSFMEDYTDELNLDAIIGITIGKAQIEQALNSLTSSNLKKAYGDSLKLIVKRSDGLNKMYAKKSPEKQQPTSYRLYEKILPNSLLWYNNVSFQFGLLDDLGINTDWTASDFERFKSASVYGVHSDDCISELLEENYSDKEQNDCIIGHNCAVVMIKKDFDLYMLTHQLLYLQIARGIKCVMGREAYFERVRKFCSKILMEAKTIEYLNYPNYDLFFEQVTVCGIEGFEEFLTPKWRKKAIEWQTVYGCYKDRRISKRTAHRIQFGCVDHTTGLAFSVLSLNVRYLISNLQRLVN